MDFCDMQIKIEYAFSLVKTEEEKEKIHKIASDYYIHYRGLREIETSLLSYINDLQTRGA